MVVSWSLAFPLLYGLNRGRAIFEIEVCDGVIEEQVVFTIDPTGVEVDTKSSVNVSSKTVGFSLPHCQFCFSAFLFSFLNSIKKL